MVKHKGATARAHRRQKQHDNNKKHLKDIQKLLKKYDTSNTGALEKDELASLLKELNNDVEPTSDEVDFVLKAVDARDGTVNDAIDVHELETAMLIWKNYQEMKWYVDPIFEKFDTDRSGTLDFAQMKAVLTELNEGMEVDDDEVKHVMERADTGNAAGKDGEIDRSEVQKAIAEWFGCVERRAGKTLDTEEEDTAAEAPMKSADAPSLKANDEEVQTTCVCVIT